MEYLAMLSEPGLVEGLQELLVDPDPTVVKRTIRVFTNVYRHALELLAAGDLEYDVYTAAWPAVKGIAVALLRMVPTADDQGILVHLVRFLEASLLAHLLSDVTRYPDVVEAGKPILEEGLEALQTLVATPYVGGMVYIAAVKALISVTCYKNEIRSSVVQLIMNHIKEPHATLFDHNVRSFHKILQRNLFRLLKRSVSDDEKEILIDMMVSVGVPRRMLVEWTPQHHHHKRSQIFTEERASKRMKISPTSSSKSSGRSTPDMKAIDEKTTNTLAQALKILSEKEIVNSGRSLMSLTNVVGNYKTDNKMSSQKSEDSLNFLKKLIPSSNPKGSNFLQICSESEKMLFKILDQQVVAQLVFATIKNVPDNHPSNMTQLFKEAGMSDKDDVVIMRERLTKILAQQLSKEEIKSIYKTRKNAVHSPSQSPTQRNTPSPPSRDSNYKLPPLPPLPPLPEDLPFPEIAPPLPTNTPPFTPPSSKSDGDENLRVFHGKKDVDMRFLNRQTNNGKTKENSLKSNSNADPRFKNKDPRISKSSSLNSISDPRLSSLNTDPRLSAVNTDPRLSAVNGDPRLSAVNKDPRMSAVNSDPRLSAVNGDPRLSAVNGDPRLSPLSSMNNGARLSPNNIDPRFYSSNNDPRIFSNNDPRLSSNVDPRLSANVSPRLTSPNNDSRLSPNIDPRLSPNIDPRMSAHVDYRSSLSNPDHRFSANNDPRLTPNVDPRSFSPNVDPRMSNADPRMLSSNVDPRMLSSNVDPRMSNADPRMLSSNVDPRMSFNMNGDHSFSYDGWMNSTNQGLNGQMNNFNNGGTRDPRMSFANVNSGMPDQLAFQMMNNVNSNMNNRGLNPPPNQFNSWMNNGPRQPLLMVPNAPTNAGFHPSPQMMNL